MEILYAGVDPSTDLIDESTIRATPDDQRRAEINALRRSLATVEERIAHYDDGIPEWQTARDAFEAGRASLQNESKFVRDRIKLLERQCQRKPAPKAAA